MKAQEMLNQYISQGDDTDVAVRIEIVGRGPNGFNYDLQLVPLKDAKEGDLETESNGLSILIAERSVQYICLLYTSPSPRDQRGSRMPSSA